MASKKTSKTPHQRVRNFKIEYATRVAKGLQAGKSRSQARGHARAGERPKPAGPRLTSGKGPEESAIRAIARGSTLRAAVREFGLREETFRRYFKENVQAERVGRKWAVTDNRPRQFPIFSNAAIAKPWLAPAVATQASEYMKAVNRFLFTGRRKILKPFEGGGVTDIRGRRHVFETDPDALYELDAAGELSFPELYKIVS